jgi:hypothetical protein
MVCPLTPLAHRLLPRPNPKGWQCRRSPLLVLFPFPSSSPPGQRWVSRAVPSGIFFGGAPSVLGEERDPSPLHPLRGARLRRLSEHARGLGHDGGIQVTAIAQGGRPGGGDSRGTRHVGGERRGSHLQPKLSHLPNVPPLNVTHSLISPTYHPSTSPTQSFSIPLPLPYPTHSIPSIP